MFLFFFFIW